MSETFGTDLWDVMEGRVLYCIVVFQSEASEGLNIRHKISLAIHCPPMLYVHGEPSGFYHSQLTT